MKSSSHGRFTSAVSIPHRFTLNLILILSLGIPTAFTLGAPGPSIRGVLLGSSGDIFTARASDNQLTRAAGGATRLLLPANSDPIPQALPYIQDFSSLAHSSTVYLPGWQGWQVGVGGSGGTFKTIEPTSDVGLTANGTASSTAGAVHNYDAKIGTLSTGSVDPSLVVAVNTEGYTGVTIGFDVMTIRNPYNGTTNTRINEIDLQYRVCSSLPCSGMFASASATPGIYQNNTALQTSGTVPQKSETRTIALPAAVNHQANVQLRWVQRDVSGTGSRPSFAIDNVSVTGVALCSVPAVALEPTDQTVTYGDGSVAFTSTASGDPSPAVQWEVDMGSGFIALSDGGSVSGANTTMLTISNPTVALDGTAYRAVFTNVCDGTQTATSQAADLTVEPLTITVTPDAGQSRVYGDAEPELIFSYSPLLVASDSFAGALSRDAGEAAGTYSITTGTLSLSSNYSLNFTPGVTFEITPKTLVASVIANDRVYDGTTGAAFECSLSGVVGSDDVSCSGGNAAFAGANAGVHTVTVNGLGLAGAAAGNYVLPVTAASGDAEILPRPVTVAAVAETKVYDGTIVAYRVPIVSTGSIVAGDAGIFTQSFDTRHAGSGKTLTPTGSITDGNGGNNYSVTFMDDRSGVIIQKPVTVTAIAATKVFDGNVSSSAIPNVTPALADGDAPNFFQTYDTSAPGSGKTLTPAGIADDGNFGANYSYVFVPVTTGVITATYCFDGFHSPIGGSVENGNGGSFAAPAKAFRLNSTIPIKFTLLAGGCGGGTPIITGVHTLQMIRYANAVDSEPAIDATPTDAATTGNQFRLSETDWVYNLDTKRTPGISAGTWLVKATLFDGAVRTVWISIKK